MADPNCCAWSISNSVRLFKGGLFLHQYKAFLLYFSKFICFAYGNLVTICLERAVFKGTCMSFHRLEGYPGPVIIKNIMCISTGHEISTAHKNLNADK